MKTTTKKPKTLNDYLNLYSSRNKAIDWKQVHKRIQSRPRQVNNLTLFHAVQVGAKNEHGQLDFPGSTDDNAMPLHVAKDIVKLSGGTIEVSGYKTLLLYALLNNSITTEVFQYIVEVYKKWFPQADLLSQSLKSYSSISEGRTWSRCKTSPRRK